MSSDNKEQADSSTSTRTSEQGCGARDADFSVLDQGEVESASIADSSDRDSDSNKALVALKREVEEHKDKYLRALADMENYKKRALKERSELIKYQGERILGDLLEVVDNLELALAHSAADPEKLKAGLELTHKLFVDVLGRWEIRGTSAMGKDFDPLQHQAVSRLQVDSAKPGTVINEFKKAYFYKDKLLRPGTVVVAAEPEGKTETKVAEQKGEEPKEDLDS